jgi:hypothetical protein
MTVFFRLLFGYMLTEFVFFRNATFSLKQKNKFTGNFIHGIVYFIVLAVLTFRYLDINWVNLGPVSLDGWAAIFILALLHIMSDLLNRSDLAAAANYNTFYFIVWQAIAVLILFLVFPIVPFEGTAREDMYLDRFFIVATGCIFVTYVLMMLLFFIKKDLKLEKYPILDERYATMLFRLIFYLLLLVPSYWGYVLGASWAVLIITTKGVTVFDPCNMRISISVPLTIIAAIATRALICNL